MAAAFARRGAFSNSLAAAAAAARRLPRKLRVSGDWVAIAPIGYLRHVEGRRPDVAAFPAAALIEDSQFLRYIAPEFMGRYRAVYLAEETTDHRPLLWKAGCILVPEGPVTRVYRRPPNPETISLGRRSSLGLAAASDW
jgi:hypothetical protein